MEDKEKKSVQDEQFNGVNESTVENTGKDSSLETAENTTNEEVNEPQETTAELASKDNDAKSNTDEKENEFLTQVAELAKVDYTQFSKVELNSKLQELINTIPVVYLKDLVEIFKNSFYKLHKAENETIRNKFVEDGGIIEDFKPEKDMVEVNFKELLKIYRDRKSEFNRNQEEEKKRNLDEKYTIIEEIKDLINGQESINQTFDEFRKLQDRWHNIGLVPQQNVKDLWELYHHHVEKFYDYIKINKELRDLDLKKNLEKKIVLCEKAEELLLETNIISAFKDLQKYHDQWREIGPVPREMKEEIWDRFKKATDEINKKHQEHFENLKEAQQKNLEAKEHLCEQVEELLKETPTNYKAWDQKSEQLIELQKVWKTIGFAPKKENNTVYARFREVCDQFFSAKREFYNKNKEEQKNNLQLKTELCVQAEAMKDSTDWKKTTDDFIRLQKKWKQIGLVPKKYSDIIWKRFRTACDAFFENKTAHYNSLDSSYETNLVEKQKLIDEIKNFELGEDIKENLNKLKDIQARWAKIGFVPFKEKERIQKEYRELLNDKFDKLHLDDEKRNMLKFKNKIQVMQDGPKSDNRINHEREKFYTKIKQLESDITLWENNIGFFANSKNAASMIAEVEKKIENAKRKIKTLEEKIRLIDNL